jgi:hypothetical protein
MHEKVSMCGILSPLWTPGWTPGLRAKSVVSQGLVGRLEPPDTHIGLALVPSIWDSHVGEA